MPGDGGGHGSGKDPKPILDINLPLDQLVDAAEECLATEPSVFQKMGELVSVVEDKDGGKVLKPLKAPLLRYMLSRVAIWVKGDDIIHPLSSVASILADRSVWPHVRSLRTITAFPPLSPTGKIVEEEGYHSDIEVFFTGEAKCNIPPYPTQEDAVRSVDTLLDIVCDFPFAADAHRSAWLAALLSPLSRFAHDGNIPLVIIQANSPRVGKTTLAQIISYIITGRECPVITHTKSEDEQRKRILSYLRVGRNIVVVDNVVGEYGGATINALATTRSFEDRVLNQTKILQVMNDATWFITGNNILLAPDTAERCLNIRLYSPDEKPHLRTGFKHDVFNLVKLKRNQYLSAALTILKAYILAGMPDMNLQKWGSFEPWSKLVRGSLVWAGMVDPAISRRELELDADVGRYAANALIEGWAELQIVADRPNGLTTREAFDLLVGGIDTPRLRHALSDIVGQVGKIPNAHTIGRHLREIKDRNFNGKRLSCIPDTRVGHTWFVVEAESGG